MRQDSRRRMALLGAVVLVVATGLAVRHQRRAYLQERDALRLRIEEARRRVNLSEEAARRRPDFVREVRALEQRLEQYQSRLPSAADLAAFLSTLADRAAAEGVAIRRVDTGTPVKREGYREMLISATLSGPRASVERLLAYARGQTRIVHVGGDVRRGGETEVGAWLYFRDDIPRPSLSPVPVPRPRWLWPFGRDLDHARAELAAAERRRQELLVLEKQLEERDRKSNVELHVSALIEKVRASAPGLAAGRARLADHHWIAGRYALAVAAYRAALPGPDDLLPDTGFFARGRVYFREPAVGGSGQTAYLVGVDAASGAVVERHALPGLVRAFRREGDAVVIACVDRIEAADAREVRFTAEGLVVPPRSAPPAALTRTLLRYSTAALAPDFLGRVLERREARSFGTPPVGLAEVEDRLARAVAEDPTNPWTLFFLGAAQFVDGRDGEARAHWGRLWADGFGGVPYHQFAAMADLLERLGLPDLADRAYEEARRRRARSDEVSGPPVWWRRWLDAPFVSNAAAAAAAGRDLERQHQWLERARELTGIAVNDDLAARAWERHYRRQGDTPRAERERAFFAQAHRHEVNARGLYARFEAAFYGLVGALAGFWALVAAALARAPRRPMLAAASGVLLAISVGYVDTAGRLVERQRSRAGSRMNGASTGQWVTRWMHVDDDLGAWLLEDVHLLGTNPTADRWMMRYRAAALSTVEAAVIVSLPAAQVALVIALRRRRGQGPVTGGNGGSRPAARAFYRLVPGLWDLVRGSAGRGYAAFAAFVAVATAVLFFDVDAPAAAMLGPHLSSEVEWYNGVPLPQTPSRLDHWRFMGAVPAVAGLWASLAVAALLALVLHASRLSVLRHLPRAPEDPRVLPRVLLRMGVGLLWSHGVLLILAFAGVKLAWNTPPPWGAPIGALTQVTFVGGLLVALAALAWTPPALVFLIRRRRRPARPEGALIALLAAEAVGLIVLFLREGW